MQRLSQLQLRIASYIDSMNVQHSREKSMFSISVDGNPLFNLVGYLAHTVLSFAGGTLSILGHVATSLTGSVSLGG